MARRKIVRRGIWIPGKDNHTQVGTTPRVITNKNSNRKYIYLTNGGPGKIVVSQLLKGQQMDFYIIPENTMKILGSDCAVQEYWCRGFEEKTLIIIREE